MCRGGLICVLTDVILFCFQNARLQTDFLSQKDQLSSAEKAKVYNMIHELLNVSVGKYSPVYSLLLRAK